MKSYYKHLTQEQRYTTSAELKSGKPRTAIANDLGISRQTLWREISRNTGQRGYRPVQAHSKACSRRPKGKSSFREFGKAYIAHLLRLSWRPEQISCALTVMGWQSVPSHEWIYSFVYSKRGQDQSLRAHLRCQKTYRKRGYRTRDRRGLLSKGTSIHERAVVIETRQRIGDVERGTIIGKHHKGAALTPVDRQSLYLWIQPLAHRYAQTTADVFFADAYQRNQRARNENTNGLIRQYLPKSIPLDAVCPKFVQNIAYEMNNRPRKSLNWLMPAQVLAGITRVALHT